MNTALPPMALTTAQIFTGVLMNLTEQSMVQLLQHKHLVSSHSLYFCSFLCCFHHSTDGCSVCAAISAVSAVYATNSRLVHAVDGSELLLELNLDIFVAVLQLLV